MRQGGAGAAGLELRSRGVHGGAERLRVAGRVGRRRRRAAAAAAQPLLLPHGRQRLDHAHVWPRVLEPRADQLRPPHAPA